MSIIVSARPAPSHTKTLLIESAPSWIEEADFLLLNNDSEVNNNAFGAYGGLILNDWCILNIVIRKTLWGRDDDFLHVTDEEIKTLEGKLT